MHTVDVSCIGAIAIPQDAAVSTSVDRANVSAYLQSIGSADFSPVSASIARSNHGSNGYAVHGTVVAAIVPSFSAAVESTNVLSYVHAIAGSNLEAVAIS